jgi:preprotein translocase subunit SecA
MRRLRTEEELVEYLAKIARNVYEEKGNLPEKHDLVRSQKTFALKTLDTLWAEHLELLETLQDEGNLLSYGQRDPFVEYALEARKFFDLMVQNLQSRIVRTTYQILLWGKSAEHVSTPLVVVERAGA